MQFVRVRQTAKEFELPDLGAHFPLFNSVMGLTLLTLRRDADIADLAARFNETAPGAEKPADLARVMEHVRRFRNLGYGIGFDFFREGLSSISWALRPKRSSRAVVVSVLGPTQRLKAESEAVVRAAGPVVRRYTA
jgi:DNA-binding IclR family transcriptional regulator